MKNTLLLLTFLALSACGQLQSEKIRPPGSGVTTQAITLSFASFQSQCTAQNGIVSSDQTLCLARVTASAAAGQAPGVVPIDSGFANGNYIVSSGPSANVDITLNGRHVSDANARMMLIQGNGQLAFNVTTQLPSPATAIVYHCYDRNMHYVYCNDGVIPR